MIIENEFYKSDALKTILGDTIRPGGLGLTDKLLEISELKKGQHMLDVACGLGTSVFYLREKYGIEALGIDKSESTIRDGLLKFPNIPLKVGNAYDIDNVYADMDAVILECAFSLMYDFHSEFLNKVQKVLLCGGYLLLSDIYIKEGKSFLRPETVVSGFTTKSNIIQMIEESGFRNVYFEDCSNVLSQMIMDIVMKFASVKDFYCSAGLCEQNRYDSIRKKGHKIGYYILVAQK